MRWQRSPEGIENRYWNVPSEIVYLKETIGPYTREESTFNPVEVLSLSLKESLREMDLSEDEASYRHKSIMMEKVEVVFLGRDPFQTWASWKEKFSQTSPVRELRTPESELFENFLTAYEFSDKLRRDALSEGLRVTHYVLEAHKFPEENASRLFNRLGLAQRPIVSGWQSMPSFGSRDSNVFMMEQPKLYSPQVAYNSEKVKSSEGLAYQEKDLSGLPLAEANAIKNAGLVQLYEDWRKACEDDLGVEL